jgi:hypothetical protein
MTCGGPSRTRTCDLLVRSVLKGDYRGQRDTAAPPVSACFSHSGQHQNTASRYRLSVICRSRPSRFQPAGCVPTMCLCKALQWNRAKKSARSSLRKEPSSSTMGATGLYDDAPCGQQAEDTCSYSPDATSSTGPAIWISSSHRTRVSCMISRCDPRQSARIRRLSRADRLCRQRPHRRQ